MYRSIAWHEWATDIPFYPSLSRFLMNAGDRCLNLIQKWFIGKENVSKNEKEDFVKFLIFNHRNLN